ncbi:MAG: hypothetical protein KGJ62_05655 [Armatimonadetes bacterium]|nr:hypothetical protein [Armatimonadota bacterium]
MANFHPQVMEAVAEHFDVSLTKITLAQYRSAGDEKRFTCGVSKTYPNLQYWYGFQKKHFDFLQKAAAGYAAFGCGSANRIVVIPLAVLRTLVQSMDKTVGGKKDYWHVRIYEDNPRLLLGQPGRGNAVDVSQYLLS